MNIDQENFDDLNVRFDQTIKVEAKTERQKLEIYSEGWKLIHQLGGPSSTSIAALCTSKGIDPNADNEYWAPAQLVTGYVIAAMNSPKAKKGARNHASRAVTAFRGLDLNQEELLETEVDEIVDWIERQGGVNGLAELLKAEKVDADEEVELFDAGELTDIVLRDGLSFDAPLGSLEPEVGLSLHYRDGDKFLVLPLRVSADTLRIASGILPDTDLALSEDVRLWTQINEAAKLFDRTDSRIDLHAKQANDDKAPSLPVMRVFDAETLAISATRVDAGMVVHVVPDSYKFDQLLFSHHFNGSATTQLDQGLNSSAARAIVEKVEVTRDAQKRTWLTFKAKKDAGKSWRVRALPMSEFGSTRPQWTLGIGVLNEDAYTELVTDDGLPADLMGFVGKAASSKHPMRIIIKDGELSLKLGKAAALAIGETCGGGNAKLDVVPRDLARVLAFAKRVGATHLTFLIDERGVATLLMNTEVARFEVYIPALLPDGSRSASLFEVVSKPAQRMQPKPEVPVSEADAVVEAEAAEELID